MENENMNEEENIKMDIENNKASGYFDALEENIFSVNLFDKRGITNRDPIQYKIQIILLLFKYSFVCLRFDVIIGFN